MNIRITTLHGPQATETLARLSRFHYRAGEPASPSRVLAASNDDGPPIGVLCLAFPTLNAQWRRAAWPCVFGGSHCARASAALLNAHVRTIARVIIDPRWRGVGLAARLVREYLKSPDTPLTEAVASMGRFCPFFEAAGMRRVPAPPSRRDARLARVLEDLGIAPASLADVRFARRSVRTTPALAAALLTWAKDSKSTRRHTSPEHLPELAVLAAEGVTGKAVYVWP